MSVCVCNHAINFHVSMGMREKMKMKMIDLIKIMSEDAIIYIVF